MQTKCHKIDAKRTLVVDGGKSGQLNGNRKVCVLHLRETELSKMLSSIKGRYDFGAPVSPQQKHGEQYTVVFFSLAYLCILLDGQLSEISSLVENSRVNEVK